MLNASAEEGKATGAFLSEVIGIATVNARVCSEVLRNNGCNFDDKATDLRKRRTGQKIGYWLLRPGAYSRYGGPGSAEYEKPDIAIDDLGQFTVITRRPEHNGELMANSPGDEFEKVFNVDRLLLQPDEIQVAYRDFIIDAANLTCRLLGVTTFADRIRALNPNDAPSN